jgi:threonine/homoserine/homoserine lactone efflux protein
MDHFAALIVATAFLVLIPGPNVALIVATSIARGTRSGLLAVAGTSVGVALQLAFTVFGLAALVAVAADVLTWLKWAGVAYLVYLGIRTWNAPADDLASVQASPEADRKLFWGALAIAVVNPKTLVFNSAFLPQFVTAGSELSVHTQFVLVSFVFLAVIAAGDSLWAVLAGRARGFLKRFGSARNKVSGAFLVGAGAALALTRR